MALWGNELICSYKLTLVWFSNHIPWKFLALYSCVSSGLLDFAVTMYYPFMQTVNLSSSWHKKPSTTGALSFDRDPSVQQTMARKAISAVEESRASWMTDSYGELPI